MIQFSKQLAMKKKSKYAIFETITSFTPHIQPRSAIVFYGPGWCLLDASVLIGFALLPEFRRDLRISLIRVSNSLHNFDFTAL